MVGVERRSEGGRKKRRSIIHNSIRLSCLNRRESKLFCRVYLSESTISSLYRLCSLNDPFAFVSTSNSLFFFHSLIQTRFFGRAQSKRSPASNLDPHTNIELSFSICAPEDEKGLTFHFPISGPLSIKELCRERVKKYSTQATPTMRRKINNETFMLMDTKAFRIRLKCVFDRIRWRRG